MKTCEFSKSQFAALRVEGDHTGPQRQAILETHGNKVQDRIATLGECLHDLDAKIVGYAVQEEGWQNDGSQTGGPGAT